MLEYRREQQGDDRHRHADVPGTRRADPSEERQVRSERDHRSEHREIEQRQHITRRGFEGPRRTIELRDQRDDQGAITHGPGDTGQERHRSALAAYGEHIADRGEYRPADAEQDAECRIGLPGREIAPEQRHHPGDPERRAGERAAVDGRREEDPNANEIEEHDEREHHRDQARGDVAFGPVHAQIIEPEEERPLRGEPAVLRQRKAQRPAGRQAPRAE